MSDTADSDLAGLGSRTRDRADFERLERQLSLEGQWDQLVGLYEQWLRTDSVLADAAAAAELHFRRGRVLEERIGDSDGAIEAYWAVAQLHPSPSAALRQLRRIHARREDWAMVEEIADLEARTDMPPHARATSRLALEHLENPSATRVWLERAHESSPGPEPLLEAAELCRELDDDERALDHLRSALLAAPTSPEVALQLDRCLGRLCRDAERVEVLSRRVELADSDSDKAKLLGEIARLQEEVLENPDAACTAWSHCFEHDPCHPEAVSELVARLSKLEQWDRLRSVLERACEEGREEIRAGLLCSLGNISMLHFGDAEAAARVFEIALDHDPEATRAIEGLAQIARDSGDDDAIVRAYAREAEVTDDGRRLATLVWELVRIHDSRDEPDAALAWLARLHEAEPEDRACLEAIVDQHERRADTARGDDWLAALEALQALASGSESAAICTRLATLHRTLGDRDQAIRWAEASLEADPGQREAARELVGLYRDAGLHEDRARVQRRLADLLTGEEQRACLIDLANLVEHQLGDLDAAILILRPATVRPDCDIATRDHLAALLERAGRSEELAQQLQRRYLTDDDATVRARELRRARLLLDPLGQFDRAAGEFRRLHAADPDCSEALGGLERALREGRDIAGLVQLLGERAACAADAQQRHPLELERARLLEEGPFDFEQVHAAYSELADQQDDVAIATNAAIHLETLLERAGDWAKLRSRLEASLGRRDGNDDLALRERLAALCRDRLGDNDAAIEHFEAAGLVEPQRARIWQALALLYDSEERTEDLRRVIRAELACDLEASRESALRARAARLCAGGDPDEARSHFERVLELEPGHAEAVEFLADRYGEAGEHARLVELLEERLAICTGDAALAQRTSLRLRIAALQADSLSDVETAITTLEAAHAEGGPAAAITDPLADLLQRAGHAEQLIALCREVGDGESSIAERARWQMRLADTLRTNGDLEKAVAAYREVDGARPGDGTARAALRSLYRELDWPEALADLLAQQLRQPQGANETPADPAPIHSELAALYVDRLGRPEDALVQLRQVLAIDPSDAQALRRALDLAEAHAGVDVALELLSLQLDHVRGGLERAHLLEQRGRLLSAQPERIAEAIDDLREVLRIQPDNAEARSALRGVYEVMEHWPAALDCLFEEARQATATQRIELLEQGAALSGEHLSIGASLAWLERLREELPDDPHPIERIAEVHRQAGHPEALLRTIDQQIALAHDPTTRRNLHLDRARILERDLASPGRALAALDAAHDADPRDTGVVRELARLRGDLGLVREQVAALEELVQAGAVSDSPEATRELHEQCARLCSDGLREHGRAQGHFEAALELMDATDPKRTELLRALGESLLVDGRTSQWASVAESELAQYDEPHERALELREALARSYDTPLASREAAMAHWRALGAWAASGDARCSPERRDTIERELLAGLRHFHNPIELEVRLATWLARHPDDTERWLELAQLREEVLHSASGAAEAYRGALLAQPALIEAWRGLRGSAERLGAFDEVADTIDQELALRSGASALERATLLRRLGSVAWHRLNDGPRAEHAFSQARELDPGDLSSLRSLQQLHESRSDHAAALSLYEHECELLDQADTERRTEAWLRAGELARSHTNEPERALEAYEAAAELGRLPAGRELEWVALLAACGEPERHAEVLESWCDRHDSRASARDHLALADQLSELGRSDEALERTRAATRCEGASSDTWDTLARRCDEAGQDAAAAQAFERSAELSTGRDACSRYIAAALSIEAADAPRALSWLQLAAQSDPGDATTQAHLARAAERAGQLELAERAAGRALTLASSAGEEPDAPLDASLRLEALLVGGRCARLRNDLDAATISLRAALRVDPEHAEALSAAGEVLHAGGDAPAARELLERRLALGEPDDARGAHLAIIGEALEMAGHEAEALDRFQQAVEIDPGLDAAHAGLVGCLERAERPDDAVAALEHWAAQPGAPKARADALRRAASLELAAEHADAATSLLRRATTADPRCTGAWCELAERLALAGDDVAALAAAERGAASIDREERGDASPLVARLARVRAGALERTDRVAEATEAWGEVFRHDARDAQAALEHSRLLRSSGNWTAASDALGAFANDHPDPNVLELAVVNEERARLLAGPLEDIEQAVLTYERALVLDPTRSESRAKLASLLALLPGRRRDAVVAHSKLLRLEPANRRSLRALLRIAKDHRRSKVVETGLGIVRALGIATESERRQAAGTLKLRLAKPLRLEDEQFERLRLAVNELREAFAPLPPGSSGLSSKLAPTRADVQAELAAPGLDALDQAGLQQAVFGVAALALDPLSPHAKTKIAAALHARVGRRALRRARRHLGPNTLEQICRVDVVQWRDELRGLAAAVALDRGECDLRSALVELLAHDRPDASPGEDGDLCALVEACPAASALLSRLVMRWCKRIERSIRRGR